MIILWKYLFYDLTYVLLRKETNRALGQWLNDPFTGVTQGHQKTHIFTLRFKQQQNYTYEIATTVIFWRGSPQHAELKERVAALGRLGTTALGDVLKMVVLSGWFAVLGKWDQQVTHTRQALLYTSVTFTDFARSRYLLSNVVTVDHSKEKPVNGWELQKRPLFC